MRVGQILPMVGPAAGVDAIDAVCQEAERLALDSVWVVDHVALPAEVADPYPYLPNGAFPAAGQVWLDAPSVLAYVAARTSTVRIGTAILVLPYRNPLVAAKMLATVDVLSAGRLVLGVGVGWLRQEFEALGLPFAARGQLVDEQLEVLQAVWNADVASYEGEHYRFQDVSVTPAPVQAKVPILVGGTSDAALRRVLRVDGGWVAIALTPEEVRDRRDRLAQLAEQSGDGHRQVPVYLQVAVAFTDRPVGRDAFAGNPAVVAGTPEQVAERLAAYGEAGVEHVIANAASVDSLFPTTETALRTLTALAEEVRPALIGSSETRRA